MKHLVLISILGALSLTAMAQGDNSSETITISGAKTDLVHQSRPMSSDEFSQFAGSYELSNGNSLALFSRGQLKFAAVHGGAWHEIVATSSNSFIAKDKKLQMTINHNANGDVSGELLMAAESGQVASGDTGEHWVKLAIR
ncbi:MAG TPA: hypothetical protein VK832_18215 [Burkholderiaceae bacterium]|nr:hypothetical protein [Burkholderiaceae bacterium]